MEREVRKDREKKRERDREYEKSGHNYKHRSEKAERDIDSPRDNERFNRAHSSERNRPKEREFSPIPENGAGDCLSIEETNKLRAKLGLKPLEVESSKPSSKVASVEAKKSGEQDLSSYKDEWGEFLHKPAEDLKEKAKAEKLREKLKQKKEKRFLEERLARIKTLGESDEDVDDVSKWVQRSKRVVDEKKVAEQRVNKKIKHLETRNIKSNNEIYAG